MAPLLHVSLLSSNISPWALGWRHTHLGIPMPTADQSLNGSPGVVSRTQVSATPENLSETQALWPPLRLLETLGVGAQQCVPESPLQVILMPAKVWEPLEWSHSRPLTEEHHYSIWESIHPGACGLGSDARGTLREKEHPSLSNQPRPSCWWRKWSMSNGSSSHSSHRGFRKSHSLSNVACPMFTIHTAYFSSLLPAPPMCPLNSHHKEWLAALQRTMLLPPHLW